MDPIFTTLAGIVITAVGAYLVARRRFSGEIHSSEAADLWAESARIRDWSTKRIEDLDARVEALERVNQLMGDENRKQLAEISELTATVKELRAEIARLVRELESAHAHIKQLEDDKV